MRRLKEPERARERERERERRRDRQTDRQRQSERERESEEEGEVSGISYAIPVQPLTSHDAYLILPSAHNRLGP